MATRQEMATFDASKWKPRELVAPDGRRFTPSSRAEESELVGAHGYRVIQKTMEEEAPAKTEAKSSTKPAT